MPYPSQYLPCPKIPQASKYQISPYHLGIYDRIAVSLSGGPHSLCSDQPAAAKDARRMTTCSPPFIPPPPSTLSGMKKAPIVIDRSQKRMGDFFSSFTRPVPSSDARRTQTPSNGPAASTNVVDVLASSGRPDSAPTWHDPDFPSLPMERGRKRSRDDEDGHSSDDCIIIEPRKPKSPRMSPSPEPEARPGALQSSSLNFSSRPDVAEPGVEDSDLTPRAREEQQSTMSAPILVSSFASLSSVLTSSQRIIRDGETIAVRNSDDDFSDDSLEDIDELLGPFVPAKHSSSPLTEMSHTPTPPPSLALPGRRSARINQPSTAYRAVKAEPARAVRYNLNTLKKMAARQSEARQRSEKLLDQIQEIDDAIELQRRAQDPDLKDLIDEFGPEEGRERFKEALSRTEALQHGKHWHFFDYGRLGKRKPFECDIVQALKSSRSAMIHSFQLDTSLFRSALTSGVLLRLAQKGSFPEALAEVLIELSIQDADSCIRDSCLQVLEHVSWRPEAVVARISLCLETIGAKYGNRDDRSPLEATSRPRETRAMPARGQQYLMGLTALITKFAARFSRDDQTDLLHLCLRLGVDDAVRSDGALNSATGAAVTKLIDALDEAHETLVRSIFDLTRDETLQNRIIDIIPTTDARSCIFRRGLAAAWFFESKVYLESSLLEIFSLRDLEMSWKRPLVKVSDVLSYLEANDAVFAVTRKTDCLKLKDKIQLLAVAFADGDFDRPSASKAADKAAERQFNASIDGLAHALRQIYGDIYDGGASHASRMEAKDVLDTLCSRLLFAVRTKPPPRKDILGAVHGEDDTHYAQRAMEQFFKPRHDANEEGETGRKEDGEKVA